MAHKFTEHNANYTTEYLYFVAVENAIFLIK